MSSSTGSLKPTLCTFDVVAITVSSVTPASSVFVIAPFAIQQAGSGAFLLFLATLFLAIPSALLSFSSDLAEMTSFTVLLIVLVYLIIALCALFSRVLRRDVEHGNLPADAGRSGCYWPL